VEKCESEAVSGGGGARLGTIVLVSKMAIWRKFTTIDTRRVAVHPTSPSAQPMAQPVKPYIVTPLNRGGRSAPTHLPHIHGGELATKVGYYVLWGQID
jgi:hypothetical protein